MISGAPPFDGATPDEVLKKQTSDLIPDLTNNPMQDVPDELVRLVLLMLARQPGSRPTVSTVVAQLQNLNLGDQELDLLLSDERTLQMSPGVQLEGLRPEMTENARTDPVMVDPYADTFIGRPVEVGAVPTVIGPGADADASDTVLNFSAIDRGEAEWGEESTKLVLHDEPAPPESRSASSVFFFLLGLGFLAAAVMLLFLSR